MKISEIRQIPAAELAERLAAEVAKYNQMVLNHKHLSSGKSFAD